MIAPRPAVAADFVIQISVDGLGSSYLKSLLDLGEAPNFQRLIEQGSGTLNARTDYDYTITLPNHISMVTGRPVLDVPGNAGSGHQWTGNFETTAPLTIHLNLGSYASSVFDVVHDHGLGTALYSGKPKFSIFERSYDAENGAPDIVGADNGRNKIDVAWITNFDSIAMMSAFASDLNAQPRAYSFVHFHDTDSAGHSFGWGGPEYTAAIKTVDGYLGQIFDLVNSNPVMAGRTAIILTSDHGGEGADHFDVTNPLDYTIPFLTWGEGVAQGFDLYALNAATRLDPGAGRPDFSNGGAQPTRNGDSGNLALSLLHLSAVPGSTIDREQDLLVAVPEPSTSVYVIVAGFAFASWSWCRRKAS